MNAQPAPLAIGDNGEPLIRWDWIGHNSDVIVQHLNDHLVLSIVPVLLGLVISLPVGLLCARYRWLYAPVVGLTSVLYAIPAIALFVVLVAFTGLTRTTVIIPLTLYTLSVLVPAVVDGMDSVPEHVRQAATAMGFGTLRRLVQVELPISVPVLMAGLRVATVSNISLVSVGALIGVGGLGELFTDGFNRDFTTPIVVGIALIIALAIVADVVLLAVQWLLTPWARTGTSRRAARRAVRAELAEPEEAAL